jgi:hypothetical protein
MKRDKVFELVMQKGIGLNPDGIQFISEQVQEEGKCFFAGSRNQGEDLLLCFVDKNKPGRMEVGRFISETVYVDKEFVKASAVVAELNRVIFNLQPNESKEIVYASLRLESVAVVGKIINFVKESKNKKV